MSLVKILRTIGRIIPSQVPRGTSIGNRILKPIYNLFFKNKIQKTTIWGVINLYLNPSECIGGNLFFSPQLYDKKERELIKKYLPRNGIFIDIGANIGAYTLWAASLMDKNGRILSIEADADTYKELIKNVNLNPWTLPTIACENIGVSDKNEILPFYKNTEANNGANTFYPVFDTKKSGELTLRPLIDILDKNNIHSVNFIKIDIEGFELKVLSEFFKNLKDNKRHSLYPKYILIEINEGPRSNDTEYTSSLRNLFKENNYKPIFENNNSLYAKDQ